ncbi:unnamed protein product, partial [Urochloa humidicola]
YRNAAWRGLLHLAVQEKGGGAKIQLSSQLRVGEQSVRGSSVGSPLYSRRAGKEPVRARHKINVRAQALLGYNISDA